MNTPNKRTRSQVKLNLLPETLEKAIQDHTEEGTPRKIIEKRYGVKKDSIRRALDADAAGRLLGRSGRPPYLEEEQVNDLIDYIELCADGQHSANKTDILNQVFLIF